MSVQSPIKNYSIETSCPIVINASESIFSYQMASTVVINKDVNALPECFPNEHNYIQSSTSINSCCGNNVLKSNPNTFS